MKSLLKILKKYKSLKKSNKLLAHGINGDIYFTNNENICVKKMWNKGKIKNELFGIKKTQKYNLSPKLHKIKKRKNNTYIYMDIYGNSLYDYILNNDIFKNRGNIDILKEDFKKISINLLSKVSTLHEKLDIAHRDLKPENILVNDNLDVKLIDFDSCIEIKNNDHYPIFGTKLYRCPSSSLHYDVIKGDIYSLGMVLFNLFGSINNSFIECNDAQHDIRNIYGCDKIINLTTEMTDENPSKRPTINEIIDEISNI